MSRDLALAERARICDLFTELGPDRPTLCDGWTNYHLAAHLVVREWKPVASLGIVSARFASLHDGAIARAMARRSYADLVARIRKGAPPWWKPAEGVVNFIEYFVHLEDVRRGAGDHSPRPENEIAAVEAGLWTMQARAGKLALRGVKGIGLDFVNDNADTYHIKSVADGKDTVSIVGRPGEIQLYLSGRKGAAQVKLEGSATAVAVLEAAKLGI